MNGSSRPVGDPIAMGIPTLIMNLRSLENTPLDQPLLSKVDTEIKFYKLPYSTHKQTYTTLLTSLATALLVLEEDAEIRAATALVETVIGFMPSRDVLEFVGDGVVTALQAPHPSANLIGFEILKRVEGTGKPLVGGDVFGAAVRRWLQADEVEVGYRAHSAIVNLLRLETETEGRLGDLVVEQPVAAQRMPAPMRHVGGESQHHRNWRSFLLDEAYGIIVQNCTRRPHQTTGDEQIPSYRAVSRAQARLLGILPDLAKLDFDALYAAQALSSSTTTPLPGNGMLLWWASTDMIDRHDDVMLLVSVEFFKAMVRACFDEETAQSRSSWVAGYVARLKESEPVVERAMRELADETGLKVARGDEGAAAFGEWLEGIWN